MSQSADHALPIADLAHSMTRKVTMTKTAAFHPPSYQRAAIAIAGMLHHATLDSISNGPLAYSYLSDWTSGTNRV